MSETVKINEKDRLYVKKVVSLFINKSVAHNIDPINEDVIRIIGEMVAASLDCSTWFDRIPRPVAPVGARPGIRWSLKQVRRIGKEVVTSDREHKVPCSGVSALKFRTRLEQAQAGVLIN